MGGAGIEGAIMAGLFDVKVPARNPMRIKPMTVRQAPAPAQPQTFAFDPQQMERRRQRASDLAQAATRPRKIEHWTQGLHQMAQAGAEGYREGQLTRRQDAAQRQAQALMKGMASGDPRALKAALGNPYTRNQAMRAIERRRSRNHQMDMIAAREAAARERIEWQRGLEPTERERLEMDVLRRQAEARPTSAKPPSGYRYKDDGETLEVIPGGPADKVPFSDAAKIAMMDKGLNDLNRAEKIVDGLTLGTRAGMAIDSGQGFELQQIVQGSIEAFLRAMTGAAAPESEVQRYMDLYGPEFNDRPSTMKRKLADLREVINRTLSRFSSGRAERSEPTPKLKIERID